MLKNESRSGRFRCQPCSDRSSWLSGIPVRQAGRDYGASRRVRRRLELRSRWSVCLSIGFRPCLRVAGELCSGGFGVVA